MTIWFDMDGTIADLYGVENWLDSLLNADPTPYIQARPLVNMNSLARILNRLQREGHEIGIVSWLAKNSTSEYDELVANAKRQWLNIHLHSVHFDYIDIIPYGSPKSFNRSGILFDDEINNRIEWGETAFNVENIIEILKGF